MSDMQGLMALHGRLEQQGFTDTARQRADQAQQTILNARPSGVYGSGRLADMSDAASHGMLDASGLFFGALWGRMLFFNGDGPLLTYARTGAGKGRDFILPNLAHVRGRSLIVTDLKDGENCYASWRHRAEKVGDRCIFLNPFGLHGLPNTRINPLQTLLDVVAAGGEIDTQANEIAQILIPPDPADKGGGWVRRGALRLLAMRMEYVAHFAQEHCTLGGLWRFVNAGQDELETSFALMEACGVEGISRRAAAMGTTLFHAPKQFEAYKTEAIEALAPYEPGKTLERATSGHDFNFGQLKHSPHSVFLIVPSEKLDVVAPWSSLSINHIIETAARERGPIRTTFILDEFPQLPPAPAIMKALRLYRGKGIQLWIFSQGRYSMEGRWSRDAVKEFEDQSAIFNTTGVEEPGLIADIEKWSGNMTVLMRGVAHNGGVVDTAGVNLGEGRRTVLQSEDIRGIGAGRQIIKVAGLSRLIVCDRLPYYTVMPWTDQILDVRDLHRGVAK